MQGADYSADNINENTFKNNLLQLAASNYSVLNSGNYDLGTAATGNLFATDPLFANTSDADGADNIWRTADDGLQLLCGSPALNIGKNTDAPALDILGNAIYNTTKDMGAYESQTDCANDIYTGAATCQTYTINNVSGSTWFHIYGVNGIIASINPNGENLGTLTVAVGDPTSSSTFNGNKFLGKNINITSSAYPTGNIPTAYSLKLYYYDTEFDEYKTFTNNPTATLADLDIAWASGGTGCTLADYVTSATNNGKILKASILETEYGTANNGFVLSFNLDHFTLFVPTITSSPAPLLVKLLTFTGYKDKSLHRLMWTAATEQNTRHFEVEVSATGNDFQPIGTVAATGNSSTPKSYTFDNKSPYASINYYRLKIVDFDGSVGYSNIISIKEEGNVETITAYPNPSTGIFTIIGVKDLANETITLTNSIGQTLSIAIQGNGELDLSAYPSSMYYLQVGSSRQVIKLVKK